jgi:MinD-like ATPase involved in chromosome partitioning or flagellar assembly
MKIQLLIATSDKDYAEHLSGTLSEKYAETYEVTVCSALERLESLLSARTFDVALFGAEFAPTGELPKIRLPLLLWDGMESGGHSVQGIERIHKYQRISRISSEILESCANIATGMSEFGGFGNGKANITAVWSPAGGVGKTTVALAYAAQKAADGGKATYLDLECFSSAHVYFPESGKSISTVFEKLNSNAALLLKAIAQKDAGSGITYFAPPNNYDDMNELTEEDIETLVVAVSADSDELVVDLPSACDERCRKIFEKANAVFIVTDGSKTATLKLQQFATQHNLFERIRAKTVLVANRGAKAGDARFGRNVSLPPVSASDPVSVYKTLSGASFE